MNAYQMIEAGGDGALTTTEYAVWKFDKDDPNHYTYGREAMHHVLYTVANSNAMNGVSADMQVIEIRPCWKNALVAADVAFGVLAAGSIFMLVKTV